MFTIAPHTCNLFALRVGASVIAIGDLCALQSLRQHLSIEPRIAASVARLSAPLSFRKVPTHA